MAGFGEFARQWILLGRREEYLSDGEHRLWLNIGGSAGHGGSWALDISEGSFTDPGGRRWGVTLRTAHDANEERRKIAEVKKAKRCAERENEQRERVLHVLAECPSGDTSSALKAKARLSGDRFNLLIASLESEGMVERCEIKKGSSRRHYEGWRLRESESLRERGRDAFRGAGQTGQNGRLSDCPGAAGERTEDPDGQVDSLESTVRSESSSSPAGSAAHSSPGQFKLSGCSTSQATCKHEWRETIDASRPGWLRTTCKHCGQWHGNRPAGGQATPMPWLAKAAQQNKQRRRYLQLRIVTDRIQRWRRNGQSVSSCERRFVGAARRGIVSVWRPAFPRAS